MDVRGKQKQKKRRTRRNLDYLRKRSHSEVKNNVNLTSEDALGLKDIAKYNNAQITCQRLTLALFNKSIRSTTVTRVSLSGIDVNNLIETHKKKPMNNASHHSQNECVISKRNICTTNKIAHESTKTVFKKNVYGIVVGETKGLGSGTHYHQSRNGLKSLEGPTSTESNNRREDFSNFTYSNSEIESGHCSYEMFMKDLPDYLRKKFPALTSGYVNKNISYLAQYSLGHCYQENENNFSCITTTVNMHDDHRGSIIQNHMNYIETGTWKSGVKKKQCELVSSTSSSPSLFEFESNTSNVFLNSPEYQYFPHKLN